MKLRRATLSDAEAITKLVNYWFRETGDVLPRSLDDVCESIRDWVVVEDDAGIAGCGALVVMGPDLVEIRSLAVRPDYQGNGVGRKIVEELLADAAALGAPTVFTLTKVPGFFEKMGFTVTEKEHFPRKVWKDCVHCAKFPLCDEIAMVYEGNGVEPTTERAADSLAAR